MSKKSIKPMFWIYGNRRQCLQTWDNILGKLGGADKVNIVSIECGSNPQDTSMKVAEAGDIAVMLRQKDIFDTRPRIMKLRGLPEDYLGLTDYLKYIDNSNILIIWGPPGYRSSQSNRWNPATSSKFFKTIKEEGQVFDFPTEAPDLGSAKKWATDIAAERSKKFSDDALNRLIILAGKNLDIIESEVNKLCDYQTGRTISIEDIDACCYVNSLDEVWSFLDYLDHRNFEKSLMYIQGFYDQAGEEKGETFYGKISQLFGALEQHYLFIILTYLACGDNIHLQKLQAAISDIRKFGSPKKLQDLAKGLIKPEDVGVYFSPQYIRMNCDKPSIKSVLQWPEKKIYFTYITLAECKWACRANSNNETLIKMFIDAFIMAVCDKLSYRDAVELMEGSIGYERNLIP